MDTPQIQVVSNGTIVTGITVQQSTTANDKRVRKAFNMAIDKVSLARFCKTVKPLTAFTPEGIFPGYPQPKGDEFNPERAINAEFQLLSGTRARSKTVIATPGMFQCRGLLNSSCGSK